ncbi:MAG: ABC transporter permease, partial [Acidobacteria bacterium]|nr:ABC transporter permease [Acidobacteriota bacterium]
LLQDARYGLRMLWKTPGFTLAAVVSLALGIGANTVVFSVVNAVLLKSLPYRDPARVVLLWGANSASGNSREQVSATDVADWRAQSRSFEDVSTYGDWRPLLAEGAGDPERLPAVQVGDGYFKVMKGEPLLGRTFLPEEQEDGKDFVVVLGYDLWQRRFAGDPSIVGRRITLSGRPYTVVGVMPADFKSLPAGLVQEEAQLYRPVAEAFDEHERGSRHLRAVARLKEGATVEQAQAEMTAIARRITEEHPAENTNYGVRVTPLREDLVGDIRPALLLLFGAVAFVLLIACANVGNLLLARSTARRRELAIRAALGAGGLRIVRQLLTESLLLALVGGSLGLLAAAWGTRVTEALGAQLIPWLGHVEMDARILAFTFATSVLTGVVFGLAPALRASRPDLNESLKEGARSGASASRSLVRSFLVVSEVALSLVLLVGAGLLVKSVARLRGVDPGFDAKNVATMNVWLPSAKYSKPDDQHAFYAQLAERVSRLPGVEAVGVTSVLPVSGNFDGRTVEIEGRAYGAGEQPDAENYFVSPGYLRAMSVPLVRGREFNEADTKDSQPVAVVSRTFAREQWGDADPIGKRLRYYDPYAKGKPWRTVVGVVADVKLTRLDAKDAGGLYVPEAQAPSSAMTLVVKTSANPAGVVPAVRDEVRGIDKELALFNVKTMDELVSDSILLRRFAMLLLGAFAALALVLASVGIYGVISYTVTRRTHEIGVRMALGATASDILRMVVRQGMGLTLAGVAVGVGVALALTRALRTLLYEVSPTDPSVFVGISLLLASVALAACLVPARRATRVDPMIALRDE